MNSSLHQAALSACLKPGHRSSGRMGEDVAGAAHPDPRCRAPRIVGPREKGTHPVELTTMHERFDERFARDLRRLVENESPSDDLEALAACADTVAELGRDYLGAEPERIRVDGRTILRWRFGDLDDAAVLVVGHYDTVWPVGTIETFPFRVEEGRAYGPGTLDMKAGILQAFAAVSLLDDRERRGVAIVIDADEEIGSRGARPIVEAEAQRAGSTLVFEAGGAGGAIKTRRKGPARYRITVTGKAAHAGLEPWEGVNATVEAAGLVLAIDAIGRDLGGDAGDAHDAGRAHTDAAQASTVTPTVLKSGTAVNTVPARAVLGVDVRAASLADQHRIDAALCDLRPSLPGARIDVMRETATAPLEERQTLPLYRMLVEAAHELGLEAPARVSVGGGSDGNLAAGVGSLVLDGIGAAGEGAHRPGEYAELTRMAERALLASAVIRRLTAASRGTHP